MSDSEGTDDEFDRVRERAAAEITEDERGIRSMYVGLIDDAGDNEFYFANADDADLQGVAVTQLGMMTRVLADQSDADVEYIAGLAAERAEEMDLRR
ncbi:hypothetical protein BRC68_03810 [Halobacteriales archaeon QH_6_64_20]|jgi:hypothetical protein|nr:MAG: hypothetical protein BRC68_03810 [Halobacteriales archaeon QH_6_64_20]